MTPSQKLRSIADSTGLDGIANAIREVADEIDAPAVPQGEPVAWSYELANCLHPEGNYTDWRPHVSKYRPSVPDGSIRNLKPLYTAAPSQPVTLTDEPQATPIPCAVRVGATVFDAGTPFCDVVNKALTDSEEARALLAQAADKLDDSGNTSNTPLLKAIDNFLGK